MKLDLMSGQRPRHVPCLQARCRTKLPRPRTESAHPHASPPLNLDPKWFHDHVAYTMAKYG
jgi:citronellol/citronellal dehydrogenase